MRSILSRRKWGRVGVAAAGLCAIAAIKKEAVEKKIALPGILLSRHDRAGAQEYMSMLKEHTR